MDTTDPLTLVFATHNPNKVAEVQALLGDRYRVKSLADIGCHEEIVEDAATLEGNARLKARHVVTHYGLDCFADDTGLEVEALGGAPGVRSARYAGEPANSEANMDKLLAEMDGHSNRSAQFRTAICLARAGGGMADRGGLHRPNPSRQNRSSGLRLRPGLSADGT